MNQHNCGTAFVAACMLALLWPCAALTNTNLNNFNCWSGVELSGFVLKTSSTANNADACARFCLQTPSCTSFTFTKSFMCIAKVLPIDSNSGTTGLNSSVTLACVLKSTGGSLPSPANIMCYGQQNVAGIVVNLPQGIAGSAACASSCISYPGCSLSVYWPAGLDGRSAALCQLKSNPFYGGNPSDTAKNPLVASVCLRAVPSPVVVDPLAAVAGPIPFLIKTKSTSRCLRAPSSPYTQGQALVYMSDCTSGAESLWTYNTTTQIITHYASGMCLVPSDNTNGAPMILSSSCSPTSANQITSGWLQVTLGSRYVQPSGGVANEGSSAVAWSNPPQDYYSFIPAAGQAFQCWQHANIVGSVIANIANVANANTCAGLCESSASPCTSYLFTANSVNNSGTCTLQRNPLVGGVAWSPQVAVGCINRATGGALPSPANYVCYASQRISGSVIVTTTQLSNPQQCVNLCSSYTACTYNYYTADGTCVIGQNAFYGNQGNSNNVQDPNVVQLCLAAKGAPDTIYQNGYTCFPGVNIAGDLVGSALQIPSAQACTWQCEAQSDLCSMAIYTNTELCILMANPFAGSFGTTGQNAAMTSCLRAMSGGPINSPANFLCYPSQSISGTDLGQGAGVADSSSCAAVCAATAQCTASEYIAAAVGTCMLKKNPFFGNDGASNSPDPTVSGMCLAAPNAPLVSSGFGSKGMSPAGRPQVSPSPHAAS